MVSAQSSLKRVDQGLESALFSLSQSGAVALAVLQATLGLSVSSTQRLITILFSSGLVDVRNDVVRLSLSGEAYVRKYGPASVLPSQLVSTFLGNAAAELEEVEEQVLVKTAAFREALLPQSTIISGRRGTGKTLLTRLLLADNSGTYSGAIEVTTWQASLHILRLLTSSVGDTSLSAISEHAWRAWILAELIVFLLRANRLLATELPPALRRTLEVAEDGALRPDVSEVFGALVAGQASATSPRARDDFFSALAVVQSRIYRQRPILVVIDTMERSPVYNEAVEALVGGQLWACFTLPRELRDQIVVKCLIRSEVYSYALLRSVPNPMKLSAGVVHLLWSGRELAELAAKRIEIALETSGEVDTPRSGSDSSWRLWTYQLDRFLPNAVVGKTGVTEQSFLRLLRHTQLAPRHIILGLKYMADSAAANGGILPITAEAYETGLNRLVRALAFETLNAICDIYPNIEGVIQRLEAHPETFQGNLLDKLWSRGGKSVRPEQSLWNRDIFRQVLLESGVIGVVVRETNRYLQTKFQYASYGRLVVSDRSICAIHPIFAEYLRVQRSELLILPSGEDRIDEDA